MFLLMQEFQAEQVKEYAHEMMRHWLVIKELHIVT